MPPYSLKGFVLNYFLSFFCGLFVTGVWVQKASATVSEFGGGSAFSVVENVAFSSESAVLTPCPECLSADKTASEVKSLNVLACEQMVRSEQCWNVDPRYVRDCEKEEEGGPAFGERVLGCLQGGLIEGFFGWGIGAVLGKVIVGIGALLSLPVVGSVLGVTAGGGAALYIYNEYNRAYGQVGEGEGRRLRAINKVLGNIGTGIYRLLLGNYECYNAQGRAWEVCGLLLGGGLGGKAAAKTGRRFPLSWGLTNSQRRLLRRATKEDFSSYYDLFRLRKAGISMENITKAFRRPNTRYGAKTEFEKQFVRLEKAKKLLGQSGDLSARQVEGVGDLMIATGWEDILLGIRRTGLSVDDAFSLRRSSLRGLAGKNKYTDPAGLAKYMKKREAVEKSIGRSFSERQSDKLSMVQMYFRPGRKRMDGDTILVRHHIDQLAESGLSRRQLKEIVDQGLIADDLPGKRTLKKLIDDVLPQTPH